MKEKERSIGKMMENPDSWSEAEIESCNKFVVNFNELMKSTKSYSIDIGQSNNTNNILSERFYREAFIMSAVLEAFYIKDEISYKELNQSIYNYVPKNFLWEITASNQNLIIMKMIRLGFIEVVETDEKYMPHFKITINGIKIFQDQILQNIATSSFFNYQVKTLSVKMYWLTIMMLAVTICSIIVTIYSVIK